MLREAVVVHTPIANFNGELFVGQDGLPSLTTELLDYWGDKIAYQCATFPEVWSLSSPTCGELFMAWREIEEIIKRLRRAEREAEEEATRREPDAMDLGKRYNRETEQ